jgi:hypothetical protein
MVFWLTPLAAGSCSGIQKGGITRLDPAQAGLVSCQTEALMFCVLIAEQ